ncbi:condensation domain-containing protein [Streptomyces sp. NPDC001889]
MRKDDVAIIGAAGIFPGAKNLETFHTHLTSGRESVGGPGAERVRSSGDEPGERYLGMGYLDQIDLFDHELFGLTAREAELMDPHQRILLHLTHQAVESAGYATRALRDSATAVLLAAVNPGSGAGGDRDLLTMLGTSTAALAARISYLFDFRGPALVVDTACSSGLTALGLAVEQLRARRVPLAVVGGVNVFPVLIRHADWSPLPGLESGDERCRPFDAGANGLAAGEGGGVVLVKLLSEALADGDRVLAVLKGIAVNHNGFRAASMAAPSQTGQASVIAGAWRDAGVEAATIGSIECHGSGTPLGDVVEVEALRLAFAEAGVTGPHCAIGSVKAGIGHLGNAAGIAGLFKAMTALRYGTHYPAVNFTTPNPLIDFGGPVYVNTEARPWPRGDTGPRRAGVSSWGLTGTNAHAVLEEAPAVPPGEPAADPGPELVTVSARSARALDRYRLRLADFAEHTDQPVRAVAHVLNRGRDDHPYRLAVTARTHAELALRLRSAALPGQPAPGTSRVVLLLSGDALPDDGVWARLRAEFALPDGCAELEHGAGPEGRLVVRQYALHHVARELGLTDAGLIGSGAGNLAVRAVRGRMPLADAVAAAGREVFAPPDPERLTGVVDGLVRDGAVLVEPGPGGVLARETLRQAPELTVVDLAGDGSRDGVLEGLGRLYTAGAPVDWEHHYRDTPVRRVEAPTYPFEPSRCRPPARPRPARGDAGPAPSAEGTEAPGGPETESRVAGIWEEVLDLPGIGPGSDYFMLGGTSLLGVGLLRRLQQSFGVEVTFADLYTYPTVRGLAERLRALTRERATGAPRAPIVRVDRNGPLPLSFGQEALWYLDQVNPGSPLYNVPAPLHLTGPVDQGALQDALTAMAERHEALRCLFVTDEDGGPRVTPTAPEPLLTVVDVSRMPEERRRPRVRSLIREAVSAPFDLTADTPFRAVLIGLTDESHVLVLTFHHIVFDGGSTALFGRDFAELYRAHRTGTPPDLPELPVQYQDFAVWHRSALSGERLERALEFWRGRLDGLTRPELPLDRPRPDIQSYAGDLVPFVIGTELADRVREYSRRSGVTTFVSMLAVLDAVIHLWSGHDDVVIGVATSGRVHPDVENLVGYFNNLPPFRTGVGPGVSFDELVRRCARTVAGVLDHEEVPLGTIIGAAGIPRSLARHPLYDVTYTYQNVPQYEGGMGDAGLARYEDTDVGGVVPGTAKFDLSFAVMDSGTGPMRGEVEYATALFDRATAELLARWFPVLAAAALAEPGAPIGGLTRPGEEAGADEATGPWTGAAAAGPPEEPGPAAAGHTAPAPDASGRTVPAPPGDTREILRGLFRDLIGVERVADDDDFFALGGQSVISIQLVARARRAGVVLTQRQVFELRTPAALAAVAGGTAAPAPAADPGESGSGRVPLTPVMRELAERAGLPDRFAQSATVSVPAGLDRGVLAEAARALADRHEMLRARLVRPDADPATWSLDTAPTGPRHPAAPGPNAQVAEVAAGGLDDPALDELTRRESHAAAGRLDPGAGVMLQLVHLDRGPAARGRLLLVAHHLAVDLLSWRTLIPELAECCAALAAGRTWTPEPVPVPFGRWSRALAATAGSPSWREQLPLWERVLAPGEPLPGGRPLDPARDTAERGREVGASVPAPVTAALLTSVPAAFYTGTETVLLAALAAAVTEWRAARGAGTGPVVVDVESHGRVPLTGAWELSRTVGWFTSVFPVRLDTGPADTARARTGGPSAGDIVKRVKEQLGAVPGDGVGYGVLRHLDPGTREALAARPAASIGFNYLGRLTGGGDGPGTEAPGGPGDWSLLGTGGEPDGRTPLGHAVEAVAAVVAGPGGPVLRLSLGYPPDLLDEDGMRELCEGWAAHLAGVAAHTEGPDAGGHVPSDFPLVSLNQDQIERLEGGSER